MVLASPKKASASSVVWNSPLYKRYAHIMTPVRPCSEQEGKIQKGGQRRSGEKTKDLSCTQWHEVLCCYKFSMPAFSRLKMHCTLTFPDLQWTTATFFGLRANHSSISTQKGLISSKGGALNSSKGNRATVWRKSTHYENLMEVSKTWQGYHWFMLYTA